MRREWSVNSCGSAGAWTQRYKEISPIGSGNSPQGSISFTAGRLWKGYNYIIAEIIKKG